MADLPITSDAGATPVVINDPTTTANVANVSATGDLHVQSKTEDGSGNAITSTLDSVTSNRNLDVIRPDIMVSGSLGALNATVTGIQQDIGSAVFVASGTWVGTIVAEGSADNGTTFTLLSIATVPGGALSTAGISANGQYRIAVLGGYNQVRLRMSAYTSGSASVVLNLSGVVTYPLCFQPNASNFKATVNIQDGSGTALTSTAVSTKQGLDVNLVASPSQSAAAVGQVYTTSFEFNLPTNGTESPAVYIKNPNASGKTLILKILSATCEDGTNGAAVVRIYGDPTTSANGTSQTISSTSVGGGAAASAMTAFSGPTASANGTILFAINTGSGNVIQPASMPINFDGIIRVSANHTLLVTGEPTTNNMTYSFVVMWQEV